MRAASSAPTGRFITTTPPNADIGSEASASSYASSTVAPTATPHGVACLMMAHAGTWNEPTGAGPRFRSQGLLKGEPRPPQLPPHRQQVRAGARLHVVGSPLVRVLAVGE